MSDSHPSFGRSSDRTGGSCYGRHTGIEFVSVRGELGDGLRELLIAGREGHPDQQRIVGGLHREEREQRQPLCLAERAQPAVCLVRVAGRHGVKGEVPRGESADDRNRRGEHDLGDLGDLMGRMLIPEVELGAAERHDRRRVQDPDDQMCVGEVEPAFQHRIRLVEPA